MLVKRSEVNEILRVSVEFIRSQNWHLPPFAFWSPKEWETKGEKYNEIRDNMLGWDITDFGLGDFAKVGLTLFTIRNGNLKDEKYKKPYAEKILIVRPGQVTPFHFHWQKMEDIINRGGGDLLVQVYNSSSDGSQLADTPVVVSIDGRQRRVPAGTILRLRPGESITLTQGMYHKFWGDPSRGMVLLGEVSQVNDDNTDNRFLEQVGRFPAIEEDEEPLYLLCNEYPRSK